MFLSRQVWTNGTPVSTAMPMELPSKKLLKSTDSHKRHQQPLLLEPPTNFCSAVFYVPLKFDDHSPHISALIDTGADVSILPSSFKPVNFISSSQMPKLCTAAGTPIDVQGRCRQLFFLGNRQFTWDFIVAKVQTPILGSDFLADKSLLVDCATRSLVERGSNVIEVGSSKPVHNCTRVNQVLEVPQLPGLPQNVRNQLQTLFSSIKEVFGPLPPPTAVKHPIRHHIKTMGPPVYSRPYRLPLCQTDNIKSMFHDLIKQQVIRPSDSPYASPLVLVAKKDGSTRPCVDYRRLNLQTSPDAYPLPRIEDILAATKGKFFSTIDLRNGYYQIPVAEADIPKTAVTTPFGLFEYMRMPFGLRNAAPTFQRFMDFVLRGLPGVVVYIDDILIYADSIEEHIQRIASVLEKLHQHGLRINADKCEWVKTTLQYLGFQVSSEGYAPSLSRVSVLQNMPSPKNADELRRTLGMFNFYRSHIPNYARRTADLYSLLSNFSWSPTYEATFVSLKKELASATLLHPPRCFHPFSLHTDASGEAIGAALSQDGHPVGFYSAKLTPAEKNYSTFDKEALAVIKAIKFFRHWIEGSPTTIYTDHEPLTSFLQMKNPSSRQAKWCTSLSELQLDIRYLPGKNNVAADHLSRPPTLKVNATTTDYDTTHPWFPMLTTSNPSADDQSQSGLVLEQRDNMWWELSTGRPRLWIPLELRQQVFSTTHELGHPGTRKTSQLITSKFFWPKMKKDIKGWCHGCQICQCAKITKHQHHTPWNFPASRRFQTIHIDLVGPLPPSRKGSVYLFTMIDKFSRWIEAVPLTNISAKTCADVFVSTWVARFGIPDAIVSDQGTQFESAIFNNVLLQLGIKHLRTTTYHPQTNGAVERCHRTLKNSLRTMCSTTQDWEEKLPLVLLSLRTTISEPTQIAPCKLVLGSDIRVPVDLLCPTYQRSFLSPENLATSLQDTVESLSQSLVARQMSNLSAPPAVPPVSKWVWLRDERAMRPSLAKPYLGPYRVISQSGPVVIIDRLGREERVNYDRLKPVIEVPEDIQQRPPELPDIGPSSRPCETFTPPDTTSDDTTSTSSPPTSSHSTNQTGYSRSLVPTATTSSPVMTNDQATSSTTSQTQGPFNQALASRYGRPLHFRFFRPRYKS